jgi:protein SCO1/2
VGLPPGGILLFVSSRARLVLIVIASLALPTAVFAAFAAHSSDSNGPAAVVEEIGSSGAKAPGSPFKGAMRPRVPPTDFALRDQNGDLVQLSALRGKVVVLSPMYSTCRDTCPLTAQQIRGALDDLSGDQRKEVRAFALSVDPANDTPDSARRFLVERRVSGYLDFLVGARSDLEPVWRDFGFAPQTSEQEHNSYVVVIDKRGRQRVGFPIDYLTPEDLAHDIEVLLRQPA